MKLVTPSRPGTAGRKKVNMKKGIMDLLVQELNNNLAEEQKQSGEKWERLHNEQYQIVQTIDGVFHNPIKK